MLVDPEIGLDLRRIATVKRLVLLVAVVAVAVIPSEAQGAYFVTQPSAISESGLGPFLWSFNSDGGPEYSAVAYKVSTEPEWHDCSLVHNVELSNLLPGIYTVEVANDLNSNAAGNQAFSGRYARCRDSPAPPPTGAISVSTLEVVAPVLVQPSPTPTPTTPAAAPVAPVVPAAEIQPVQATSGTCLAARRVVHNLRGRANHAKRAALRHWRHVRRTLRRARRHADAVC